MKTDFKEYSTVGKKYEIWATNYSYPNCTMPWHQSMLEDQSYNETKMEQCKGDDIFTLWALDYQFVRKGANMNISACRSKTVFRICSI